MKTLFSLLASCLIWALPGYAAPLPPFPEPFTYENLQAFLDARPDITTVDQLLATLPLDYKKYYTMMHTSRSLQDASITSPRAIVMSIRDNLVFAFSGNTGQRRSNVVELVTYHPESASYEFRELSFAPAGVTLSDANPTLCRGCHGQDPRPIWSPYPFWEGAFGALRVMGSDADDQDILEQEGAFYRQMTQQPRYSSLLPFAETTFYHLGDYSTQNIALMRVVQKTNLDRVSRLLQATPFYQSYKFAILGALMCYEDLPTTPEQFFQTFVPASLAAEHLQSFRQEYRHDNEAGGFLYWDYLFESRGISTAEWPTQSGVLSTHSGTRFSDTDVFPGGRYYSGATGETAYYMLARDPDLAAVLDGYFIPQPHVSHSVGLPFNEFERPFTEWWDGRKDGGCDLLASNSMRALGELSHQLSPQQIFAQSRDSGATTRPAAFILQSCASCHAGGSVTTPQIPFDDVKLLAQSLDRDPSLFDKIKTRVGPGAGPQMMPPGGPLPDAERQQVMGFLEALRDPL